MHIRLLSLVVLASIACGKKDEAPPANQPNTYAGQPGYQQPGAYPQQGYPQQQPGAQPGYPQQQPGQPGYPQQQPGAMPGAPGAQPQGGVPQQPGQPGAAPGGWAIPGLPGMPPAGGGAAPGGAASGNGGTATPIDPNLAAAASAPLMALGTSEAPGAAQEGGMVAANFQQGQTLEHGFTMQPGKCYTLVAASAGIQQLDATVIALTPIPGMNPSFGNATGKPGMTGSQVSLGSKNNCIKLALSPIAIQAKFVITATRGAGVAAAQIYVK